MYCLVKGGKTNYEIVAPKSVKSAYKMAAEELQDFLAQATGVIIPVVECASADKKHIYLGVTPEGCEDKLKSLNNSGFGIKTVDGDCYLYGKRPSTVCYASYELLHILIGWESYAHDEVYFEKKSELVLPDLDITDNPDIEYRAIGIYNVKRRNAETNNWLSRKVSRRFRTMFLGKDPDGNYQDDEFYFGFFSGLFAHTTYKLLPPEKDENDNLIHPDWYSADLNQMCWSNEEAADALAENLKKHIIAWPEGPMFLIGIEDNSRYCKCPNCQKIVDKYGVGGLHIRFINRIANNIEAWRKERMPEREFMLAAFAYLANRNPAVKKNEKGEWEPIDETVRLADNVAIFSATYDECGLHDMDSPCNIEIKERFEKWAAVCKTTMVWNYHAYFDKCMISQPNYYNYADNIRRYVKYNTKMGYYEGVNMGHNAGFQDMRAYLLSKLSWDSTLDQETLRKDFFKHYYKQAADVMDEYYNALTDHYRYLEKTYAELGPRGYHAQYDTPMQPDVCTTLHWPKEALLRLKEILLRADKAAQQEPDEALREKLEKRVLTELCMIDMLLIDLYTVCDSLEQLKKKVDAFVALCERCEVKCIDDWLHPEHIDRQVWKWYNRYPARDRVGEAEYDKQFS